jgi:hypothetical protein
VRGVGTLTDPSTGSRAANGVSMTPAQEAVYRPAAERLARLHAAMRRRETPLTPIDRVYVGPLTVTGDDRAWARETIHRALREEADRCLIHA